MVLRPLTPLWIQAFGGWCPTHSGIALKSPYTWEGWWGLFWVCLFQLQEGEEFTAATSGGLLIAGKSSWPSYMFTFKLFLSIPIYSIRSYIHHCRHHRRWLHYVTLWLCHFQEMPLYQKNPRGCGPGKSKCIETRDLGVCLGTWFSGIALASAFYWFLLASWFCGPMFAILHASHLVPD